MHIAFIFPSSSDSSVRKLAYTLNQYAMNLIESLLHREDATHVSIITTYDQVEHDQMNTTNIEPSKAISQRRCFSWNAWGLLSLIWKIRWSTFDVVHLQHETFVYGGPISLFIFPCVVRWISHFIPTIVTFHHVVHPRNITHQFTHTYNTHMPPFVIRWGYALFYRLACSAAFHCIVHEECDKSTLIEAYGIPECKIAVIHHGAVDATCATISDKTPLLREFALPIDAKRIFGFFAYLDLSKGLDLLIDEFLGHLVSHPHDVLLICGALNPHYVKKREFQQKMHALQDRAENEGKGRIRWYGEIGSKQVDHFYQLINALVIPYHSFNGGSATWTRAIGYNIPCFLSEAFAECDTGPAVVFSLRQGGLQAKLHEYSSVNHLPYPADPEWTSWRVKRLWPAIGRETMKLYHSVIQSRTQKKILLLGAFGQQNLGDELLLSQCLQTLPREQCIVASADPERTTKEHAVATLPRHGIPLRLLSALLHSRVVIVGGGDQFKMMKAVMQRSRYSLLLLDALLASVTRIFRKHLFFVGVGIGAIPTRFAHFLTRWTLQRADVVLFREEQSYRIALKIAPQAHTALGTDLAFLTPPLPALSPRGGARESSVLGIAPCVHLDNADAYDHVAKEIAQATEMFLGNASDRKVTFLPFQKGFAQHHDILVSREITAKMQRTERCTIAEDLNLTNVHTLYTSLDCVWGMRLHSIILACLHAVPFIALIYDVKVKNFLEEISCTEWGIPLDACFTAEKLMALQNKLEKQLPEIREHLIQQAAHLSKRAQVNADLLRAIANEVRAPFVQQAPTLATDPLSASNSTVSS